MSATVSLKDKLKSAQTVTSLENADRILAVDTNGNLKKIDRGRVANPSVSSGNISSPQWVRFASFATLDYALLFFQSNWNNNPGVHLIVDAILHSHALDYNKFAVLSRLVNASTTVLTKLRVVIKKNDTCYLDVYYSPSAANSFSVRLIAGGIKMLASPIFNAEIPDGYTAREFSLATVSESAEIVVGGGNYLPFNRLRNKQERRCA